MKVGVFRRTLIIPALMLSFCAASQAQTTESIITKHDALKNFRSVEVARREIISDDGRLRVVFPGKPEIDDDVITVKGFRLRAPGVRWVVSYSDLSRRVDGKELRERYREATKATVRRGQVISERDVFLNGRLGSEVVIRDRDETTYMRSFISGNRLYVIAVIADVTKANPQIDDDIKRFFDSFTFWDRA